MKSKIVTLYICDHCSKKYQIEKACARHEIMCSKNPENERPCHSCKHLCKKEVTISYGEYKSKVSVLYCNAKSEAVQSPETVMKGNAFDFGGDPVNDPMPQKCDLFESYLTDDKF